MSLKHFIVNAITFGSYYRKMYKQMHGQVHKDTELVQDMVNRAKRAKKNYENRTPRAITIQSYDFTDNQPLNYMHETAKHPIFKYFLHSVTLDVYEMLNNATDDKAVEIMGMSKGIKYLTDRLNGLAVEYEEMQNAIPSPNGAFSEDII